MLPEHIFSLFVFIIGTAGFMILLWWPIPAPIPVIKPIAEPESSPTVVDTDEADDIDPPVHVPVPKPKVVVSTFAACADQCQNTFATFDDYYYRNCISCIAACEEKYENTPRGYSYGYCDCVNYIGGLFYDGSSLCDYRKGAPPRGGHDHRNYL